MKQLIHQLFLLLALLFIHHVQGAVPSCGTVPTSTAAGATAIVSTSGNLSIAGGTINAIPISGTGTYSLPLSGRLNNRNVALPSINPAVFNPSWGTASASGGTLQPGAYDNVTLSGIASLMGGTFYINTLSMTPSATVRLYAGDYHIHYLSASSNVTIQVVSGPVHIYTDYYFSAGNGFKVNRGGATQNFQLMLYPGAAVNLGAYLDFTGLILGPDASTSVNIADHATYFGAILTGGTINISTNLDLQFSATIRSQIASIDTCGLALDYTFDDCSYNGTPGEVSDDAGLVNGTAAGSIPTTAAGGKVNRALNTQADNQYVVPGSTVNIPGDYTFAFWLKYPLPNTVSTPYFTAASLSGSGGTCQGDVFYIDGSNGFKWGVSGDLTALGAISVGNAQLGAGWHHFAVSATGDTTTLYIDGDKRDTLPITANSGSRTYNLNVIGSACSDRSRGAIRVPMDEFMLFKSALSPADIQVIYSNQSAGKSYYGSPRTAASCSVPLDHLVLQHASGESITCLPASINVSACSDPACATPYTGGVTGTLTATAQSGSPLFNWSSGPAFSILPGQSSTTVSFQNTQVSTVKFAAGSVNPAPSNATTCTFGNPACTFQTTQSGLIISNVPNHIACTEQNIQIQALKQSDYSTSCVPAFRFVNRTVSFNTQYLNPASGTRSILVNGSTTPSLRFNATGTAFAAVTYSDAGNVSLTGRYTGSAATGDAGLVMDTLTNTTFSAVPARFVFDALPTPPLTAGVGQTATLSALNACSPASVTPNFGREATPAIPAISLSRTQPTGSGARNGAPSASVNTFSNGSASVQFNWDEVGQATLSAQLNRYLGSSLSVSGSSAAIGPFVPAFFEVQTLPGCTSFSYSGQPFGVTIKAYRAGGGNNIGLTRNFDGSTATAPHFADSINLSDATANTQGSLTNTAIAPEQFTGGIATWAASTSSPVWTFATHNNSPSSTTQTPQTLRIRATDAAYPGISSVGHESLASLDIRRGRLALFSAYGQGRSALALPVQTQYWTGQSWALNALDQCTVIPASAVFLAGYSTTGWTSSATGNTAIQSGSGKIMLTPPSAPGKTGTARISIHLGSTGADQSCLTVHGGTAANLAWLRAYGSCTGSWDRDPSAAASFGIFAPETRKLVHVRDLFN
ncbi:LamG domain-containing protein [Burkholderiaceae bacterium DAT-1]|nr:LamG domain-containing protein [Burkholderiaceae bacterium DAT-1]